MKNQFEIPDDIIQKLIRECGVDAVVIAGFRNGTGTAVAVRIPHNNHEAAVNILNALVVTEDDILEKLEGVVEEVRELSITKVKP